jgi:hypothetical protein
MGQKKNIAAALFFCFLLLPQVIPIVSAQTVSFAEPNTVSHKDVYLYAANGTLLGSYNTTSTGISLASAAGSDVIFTFKPQYSSPLDSPGDFLTGAVNWFQTNALSLIILGVMAGLLFRKW